MSSDFNGFIPIPIQVRSPDVFHYIYVKKHQQAKNTDKDISDRSVFAVNLPVDSTPNAIKRVCQSLGNTILDQFIQEKDNRGFIVLIDKAACARFLSKAKKASKKEDTPIKWKSDALTGTAKYYNLAEQSFPPESTLKQRANAYMQEFNQREQEEEQEIQQIRKTVDEEGFTMVVSRKKTSSVTPTPPPPTALAKKRKKEKTDFYRFQIREQKKLEMNDLLRRFQDDKKKVEELRQRKRFKPY